MGVAVIVLALGAIGTAFATSMDFSNVGALSSGKADIDQVNTDHVGFIGDEAGVVAVVLSFDRDLREGSTIWVTVKVPEAPKPKSKVQGWKVLEDFVEKEDEVTIELDMKIKVDDIAKIKKATVSVAER